MWLVREREREEELRQQNGTNNISVNEEDNISIWNRLYYSKVFRGLIVIVAIAIVTPILIFIFFDTSESEYDTTHSCSIKWEYRIPCGIQSTTYESCSERKCCFNDTDHSCYHKFRSYYYYTQNEDETNSSLFNFAQEKTPFGGDNIPVHLNVKKESNIKLSISLTTKEVRENQDNAMFVDAEYEVSVSKKFMTVEVNRSKTHEPILSTGRGPTIVSNRYWEWTVDLHADHLFGMDFLWMPPNQTITKVIYQNAENHTTTPRFMALSQGKYHGLEVIHEGPLEIIILPSRLIILRLISGNYLTLWLSTGPKPIDLLRQQRDNEHWVPVPYWTLGVHICRDGNVSDINEILFEHDKFLNKVDFPYDSDCLHENIFSLSINKGNSKIDEAVRKIKEKNKRFLMSLAPQVLVDNQTNSLYKKAEQLNILYMENGKPFQGTYLNNTVAYPDYSSSAVQQWFKQYYDTELSHLKPDGITLRSNWPVNEDYEMKADAEFQYMPQEILHMMSKTIPWNSINSTSVQHIENHNSYGFEYTRTVAAQTKLNFILSAAYVQSSPYPGHLQNIDISWINYKETLRKTLSYSVFGGPLYSVPVCGSTANFSKEINQAVCLRWYLTAATMPLFRISSDKPRRDPTIYNDVKYAKNIMINAIKIRYSLLPYYYTILSQHLPIVRPMFFNFPDNNDTFSLDEQYMVGESLLIVQPTLFPVPNIQVYLPKIPGGWYEFWGGMKIAKSGWKRLPIIENELVAFIAAGSIVPLQDGTGNTAEESRKNPFKLIIALHCSSTNDTSNCEAKGTLYLQNSSTTEFQADQNSLMILNAELCQGGKTPDFSMNKIRIYKGADRYYYILPAKKSKFCFVKNANTKLPYSELTIWKHKE